MFNQPPSINTKAFSIVFSKVQRELAFQLVHIFFEKSNLKLSFHFQVLKKMALLKLAMVLIIVYLLVVEFCDCFSYNCTVSLDGTGNFVKINDAIAAAPNFSTRRFYIHVKPGTYHEIIIVPSQKTFIALIGDDASTTIIVSNRSNATGFSTASSATLSKL